MVNVYDSEDLKKAEQAKNSSGGNSNSSSTASDSIPYSPTASKTAGGSGSASTRPGKVSLSEKIPEGEKSLYRSSSTSPGRFKLSMSKRKKWLTGGVAAGLVGGGAVFFIFVSGPLQFIHFAQLLQKFHFTNNESFGDGRSTRAIIYTISGQANKSRLGYVNNKLADKWEQKLIKQTGLRPLYTTTFPNRFAGFQIIDRDLAQKYIADFERDGVDTSAIGKNVVTSDKGGLGKNERFIDLRDGKSRTKRSAIRTVGGGTDTSKIASAMSSRLLIKRGGVDFHPLKNIKRNAGESLVKYYQKVKNERASRDRYGAPAGSRFTADNPDKDGDGKSDGSDATDQAVADKANEINDAAKEADSKGAEGSKTIKSLKAGLSKSAGPVVVVGALCTVKSFGNDIVNQQHKIIILPMMRMAFRLVATGNQVMSGQDVNADELGSVADDLNDRDEDGSGPDTGSSWTQARSIQAELGQPLTGPDLPLEAKPSRVGEKPKIVKAVDAIPGLDTTCGIFSAVSNLPIIKQAAALATEPFIRTADAILASLGYGSVDELMKSAVSLAAGRGVDPYAQGAELGNIANYGARLAANDQALAMGGRELEDEEVALLDEQSQQNKLYQNSQLAFAQKFLDPRNTDSLLGKTVAKTPDSISQIMNLSNLPKLFSGLINIPLNIFSPKTQAATNYDYGFDEYGFSSAEQADARFENPYENAELVEPRLEELNNKYGDCFATRITPDPVDAQKLSIITGETINYAKRDKDKCNDASEDLLRYRFYLADTITNYSLACYEGDDDACTQIGLSAVSQSDTSNPIENPGAAVDISQLGKSSDGLKCAEGTKDLGVVTSLYSGEFKKETGPMKIRLCQVVDIPGFGNDTNGNNISGGAVVEARVSGAWAALAKKAKTDGAGLTASSSFRLAHSCGGTGDGVACARPGQSAHQTGWAIDFSNMPVRGGSTANCSTRARANTSQWKWMYDNAEIFGIKQYSYEAWHWDLMPMENRCGKDSR